jgi:hypothetical protein
MLGGGTASGEGCAVDLELLSTLKDKLVNAKEFADVYRYFLDHFGEDPAFMGLGDRAESPFLEAVFKQVGHQLLGRPVAVTQLLLTRLADRNFLHGACMLAGTLATVVYFEDIAVGLLAMVSPKEPGLMHYARFSGRQMLRGSEPSVN